MRIINETSDELTLAHPGFLQMAFGALLVLAGGALFLLEAVRMPAASGAWVVAFLACGGGLALLFFNARVTIVVNRAAGTIIRRRGAFSGSRIMRHRTADVRQVSLCRSGRGRAAAFLVFQDRSRIRIDHDHRAAALPSDRGEAQRVTPDASIASRVARFLNVPLREEP